MPYRDATEAEIRDEPTPVLEAMADGTLGATWVSRELAKNELERRGIPTQTLEALALAPYLPFKTTAA